MSKYTLEDVKKLRQEAELAELRLHHHQVNDLMNKLNKRIDHYDRLLRMIGNYLNRSNRITGSAMIGPFLRSVAESMSEEAVGEETEKKCEPNKGDCCGE